MKEILLEEKVLLKYSRVSNVILLNKELILKKFGTIIFE